MIYETNIWKKDLKKQIKIIKKYNTTEQIENDEEFFYSVMEKSIFYSAFIIRKLIDCKTKMSDEADNYELLVESIKATRTMTLFHNFPDDNDYDWENKEKEIVKGRNICNWLIHSYVYFLMFDGDKVWDFCVSSEYKRNKTIYKISLESWVDYMKFIANDDISELSAEWDEIKKDYICTKKQENKVFGVQGGINIGRR